MLYNNVPEMYKERRAIWVINNVVICYIMSAARQLNQGPGGHRAIRGVLIESFYSRVHP